MRRYLPGLRVAHHRPVAVIDLAFLAGRRGDDDARLGRDAAAQLDDEAPDARIPRGEAVIVDEVLPDRHRVAAAPQRLGDQLAIRLAGARTRRATRPGDRSQSRWTPPPGGRFWPLRVGGHLPAMAGFAARGSVDTSGEMAGFGFDSLGRPRPRTTMPAALR